MSRWPPALGKKRTCRRRKLARGVAFVTLVSCLWPSSAQALFAGPSIKLVQRPADLRAGDEARLVAMVSHVGACRLLLQVSGAADTQSSLATIEGKSQIIWRWRVPKRPGAAQWHGTIECWKDSAAVAAHSIDAQRSFVGTLQGRRGDPPAVVNSRGLTLAEVRRVAERSLIQRIGDYGVALGPILVALSLFVISLGVRAQRRQTRAERIARLAERSTGPEFLATWSQIMLFLTAVDESACLEVIRAWELPKTSNEEIRATPADDDLPRLTRNHVLSAMNFQEECAALFNLREIDDRLVLRSFGSLMAQAFEVSWWWIHYRRGGKRFTAHPLVMRDRETEEFAEWERMVRMMIRRRPALARTTLNGDGRNDCVRALCLPPRGSLPKDWEDHGLLSKAVGDVLRRADGLDVLATKLRAKVGKDNDLDTECPERTLLVPPWREHAAAPKHWTQAVTHVAARVSRGRRFARLRSVAARLADTDGRVAYHRRYQDLAILLDHYLRRPDGLVKTHDLLKEIGERADQDPLDEAAPRATFVRR